MSSNTKQSSLSRLRLTVFIDFLIITAIILLCCLALPYPPGHGLVSLSCTLLVWASIAILSWRQLPLHGFAAFGAANRVTAYRAAMTAILAGAVPVADLLARSTNNTTLWALSAFVLLTLSLDGIDGYLARQSGLSSTFGARFDMEIDALLALVIALIIWRSGELGVWILGLGLMRYVFVAASLIQPVLRAPLFPSLRRKAVCVIQLSALCAILTPAIEGNLSAIVGGIALLALVASFVIDTHWLYDHHPKQERANPANS